MIENLIQAKIILTCQRCSYTWTYKGIKMKTNCPTCGTTVKARSFADMQKLQKEKLIHQPLNKPLNKQNNGVTSND